MSQPPYDPQWGQQPGGYGPPGDAYGPQYGDPYAQPYAPGAYGPPASGGGGNRRLLIILTIAIVVLVGGLVVALVATGGNDSPKAATSNSASVPTGTVPTGSAAGPTGGSTSPSGPSSSPPVAGTTCHVPAGATSVPTLTAPGLLADALADKTSFANAPVRFTEQSAGNTLSSLCFQHVTQEDLGLVLAFLDGAGYTKVDGKTAMQKLFQAKDTQQPKFIAITVTGTLVIDRNNFDSNTGAAEIDWQG